MVTINAVNRTRKKILYSHSIVTKHKFTLTKTFIDTSKAVAVVGTSATEGGGVDNNIEEEHLYMHVTAHYPMTEGVRDFTKIARSDNNNNNNNDDDTSRGNEEAIMKI